MGTTIRPGLSTGWHNSTAESKTLPAARPADKWTRSPWFWCTGIGIEACAILVAGISHADLGYMAGHLMLTTGAYVALRVLGNRPLINPLQAMVFYFYWLFGVAPVVVGAWQLWIGNAPQAAAAQEIGVEAMWIVSVGLPLYAWSADRVANLMARGRHHLRFLTPRGYCYSLSTILWIMGISLLATSVLTAAQWMGVSGIVETNYLGGVRTVTLWGGVLDHLRQFTILGLAIQMWGLAAPRNAVKPAVRACALLSLGMALCIALTAGQKSDFLMPFAYLMASRFSIRQRPPMLSLGIALSLFLLFVAPFVGMARQSALTEEAQSSKDRVAIFHRMIESGASYMSYDAMNLHPEILFRGIYPLAGEIAHESGLFQGSLDENTIVKGFLAAVPRILLPDKPDMKIGNYFSRTVGVSVGMTSDADEFNSLAISMPFEVVGNFGCVAGTIFFALLGAYWGLFCALVLSPGRLNNHPLAPWLICQVMLFETPVGGLIAFIRNTPITLGALYLLYRLRGKKL